jgi:uncharacterized peroxidase-related enzyme
MALVPYLTTEQLQGKHRDYAEAFEKRFGRLPFLRLMGGHFPPFLDAVDAMYPPFMTEGAIDRDTKELMFVAGSEVRGCQYCVGTHSRHLVQEVGLSREQVKRIRSGGGDNDLTEKQKALITFARRVAEDPKRIGEKDINELRELGLDDAQIVEAIAVIAMSAFTNTFADTLNLADDFGLMGVEDEVF